MPRDGRQPALAVALPLLFCSGLAGLIFEVLWLRALGTLFGNTAHAAAATLAVFFLGLSAGGLVLGRRAPTVREPWRAYAALEIGVALSAALCFALLGSYRLLSAPLVGALGTGALLTAARLLLTAGALLPPTFLMGGTLPLLAQAVIHRRDRVGRAASVLYAVNTAGATAGAWLAGFYLPRAVGFTASYWIAVGIAAGVGLAAFALRPAPASRAVPPNAHRVAPVVADREAASSALTPHAVLLVALLSGFGTLGLEVLWTRLLAQVLNNSVYAFAAVLVTFLAALGGGAVLAHALARTRAAPHQVLAALCALAALTVTLSPLLFAAITHGLSYVARGTAWDVYVRSLFAAAGLLMLVPGVLIGSVLPYLFRTAQGLDPSPGRLLGRVTAVNSLGAIAGSLTAGFVLLDTLGLWASLFAMAGLYLALAIALARPGRGGVVAGAGAAALLPLLATLAGSRAGLPVVRLRATERLERVWQGSGGTVAVVRGEGGLVLRVNNHYTLGDTRSLVVERMQAHLPLLLHPRPRSVFFIGFGTGITAGAALDHPVERVVATELIPEVVTAARAYFAPFTNGFFQDPRARVVVEDGRTFLAGTPDRYDVIVGDLFTPWHAGTGSLYTVEHFRTVRARLRPGGVFAQWIPLYQLSDHDFRTIARTMTAVFPQVTLWRGDFSPDGPIVALVAQTRAAPLDQGVLARNTARLTGAGAGEHMAGLFYAGNLTAARPLLAGLPLNTDDRPVIELLAPLSEGDSTSRLTGLRLARFYDRLLTLVPPERDAVLSQLPAREIRFVRAGLAFYQYHLYAAANQPALARLYLDQFLAVVPARTVDSAGPRLGR